MELCDSKNIVIDKIMDNNNAFYTACVDNNFEIAKYLYDTENQYVNLFIVVKMM